MEEEKKGERQQKYFKLKPRKSSIKRSNSKELSYLKQSLEVPILVLEENNETQGIQKEVPDLTNQQEEENVNEQPKKKRKLPPRLFYPKPPNKNEPKVIPDARTEQRISGGRKSDLIKLRVQKVKLCTADLSNSKAIIHTSDISQSWTQGRVTKAIDKNSKQIFQFARIKRERESSE